MTPASGDREVELLQRLHALLAASHARFGVVIDPIDQFTVNPDMEVYPCGPTGVLVFLGDYVLSAWPDAEQRAASREAYKLLKARLEDRGFTRHMVHPCNFRSVILTRSLGAKLEGVDSDGFVHYMLRKEDFGGYGSRRRSSREHNDGQEVATAEGP